MDFNMNVKVLPRCDFEKTARDNKTIYVVKDDKSVFIGKDPHRFFFAEDGKLAVDNSNKK